MARKILYTRVDHCWDESKGLWHPRRRAGLPVKKKVWRGGSHPSSGHFGVHWSILHVNHCLFCSLLLLTLLLLLFVF